MKNYHLFHELAVQIEFELENLDIITVAYRKKDERIYAKLAEYIDEATKTS